MDVVAGLHLGRQLARAVVLGANGDVVKSISAAGADPLDAIRNVARQFAGHTTIAAVGVAVDPGEALDTAALNDALEPLGSASTQTVSAGVAAMTAETWKGAAREARHAVCLWIGDAVFAGILLDGRTWAGAHGLAGSAAWLALNPVERQDYRKVGTLAAEVSDSGIARRLAWRIQAGDSSAVLERAGSLDAITAAHVYEGARTGDGVSISVVRDTAKYIGMAVANLANCLDPEVVVLAGPVAAYADLLLEPVRQECLRRLVPPMAGSFRCEMSPLDDDGVALGAARLVSSMAG